MDVEAESLSPKMDSQVKNRSALYKQRKESPEFREALRIRCKARMRASRRALLDSVRDGSAEPTSSSGIGFLDSTMNQLMVTEPMTNSGPAYREFALGVIQEEIRLLMEGSPLTWDEIFRLLDEERDRKDQADDEELLIASEYEQLLREEELTLFGQYDSDEVICPLCEKGALVEEGSIVRCPRCLERFPEDSTLAKLKEILTNHTDYHDRFCEAKRQIALLNFHVSTNLFQICDVCGDFTLLI